MIYTIKYGHVNAKLLVDFHHTLATEVSFCYHFHLNLCAFNGISLTNHCSKRAISTEITIACNE